MSSLFVRGKPVLQILRFWPCANNVTSDRAELTFAASGLFLLKAKQKTFVFSHPNCCCSEKPMSSCSFDLLALPVKSGPSSTVHILEFLGTPAPVLRMITLSGRPSKGVARDPSQRGLTTLLPLAWECLNQAVSKLHRLITVGLVRYEDDPLRKASTLAVVKHGHDPSSGSRYEATRLVCVYPIVWLFPPSIANEGGSGTIPQPSWTQRGNQDPPGMRGSTWPDPQH